jgi:hypothetical protein
MQKQRICALATTKMPTRREEVLAFDREKSIYKDSYVDNFKKVRHFPALASIGQGKADGDSLVLVQEGTSMLTTPRNNETIHVPTTNAKYQSVGSRYYQADPVSFCSQ